jgi:hypothetical protein
LESGVGFSDEVTIRLPEGLDEGTYGLSMAVRDPAARWWTWHRSQVSALMKSRYEVSRKPTSTGQNSGGAAKTFSLAGYGLSVLGQAWR